MLSESEIAEFATRIVEAAAGNNKQNALWDVAGLCVLYEEAYKTIKKMDQEN